MINNKVFVQCKCGPCDRAFTWSIMIEASQCNIHIEKDEWKDGFRIVAYRRNDDIDADNGYMTY